MTRTTCRLCGREHRNFNSLSHHLRHVHRVKSVDYYVQFYIRPGCLICGSPTKFENLNLGFKKTCSARCACTMHRQNLRADPEKQKRFSEIVSENMGREWQKREANGTARAIFQKASMTCAMRNPVSPEAIEDERIWLARNGERLQTLLEEIE